MKLSILWMAVTGIMLYNIMTLAFDIMVKP